MLYQEQDPHLYWDVINVSDVPGTQDAEPGARWSASAAAFVAWRDGDQAALEELVRLLSPTLWQVARAAGLDRTHAEDVVQTTWLALVDHADSITHPMAVAGWLCTSARRESWRVSKRVRRERPTHDDALHPTLPTAEGPEAQVVLDEDHARLRVCLGRLTERCQALLRMLAAGPRPEYAEVSAALGMAVGSIGPTRARCLDKLRRELISEGSS